MKLSDAKEWMIKLQDQDGRSYSSIHTIRGVLRPAFQMAVDDDLLRKNPFQFELVSVIVNDSVTRDAITHDEKRKFLEFVRNDKHFCKYYDGICILFYTGMRISEFVGLTIKDIDLKEKTINIDHQLQRTSQMQYIIEPPKTEAGIRVIPMQEEVCECFKRIIQNRRKPKVEPMVGGKVGFLHLDKNEMQKITPHVCRHTYCSHCASSGMNPKHLQYLMGHSDISVTLNTYTHVDFDNVKKEVQNLEKAVL